MNAYQFRGKNHRLPERNRGAYVSYEKDDRYYVWHISEEGEYIGQSSGFHKENPNSESLEHLRGMSLKEFSNSFGSWFNPKLEVYDLAPLNCSPGIISNRIWRPCTVCYEGERDLLDISEILISQNISAFNQALVSVDGIVGKLKEILHTIEPVPSNKEVYGHEFRQLLLLACMEAEAAFVGILTANNYPVKHWNTKDYVKLNEVFELRGWTASFTYYPDYGIVSPFLNWDAKKPTKSIAWYQAYNKTKHNRECHFASASLDNAVNAVCSALIMLHAQYGPRPEFRRNNLALISVSPPENYSFRKFYIPLAGGDRQSWVIEDYDI